MIEGEARVVGPEPDAADVLSSLPQPLLAIDPQNLVSYANDRAEVLLGLGRTTIVGREIAALVGATSPVLELIASVRRDRSPITQYRIAWPTPGGPDREVDVEASVTARGDVIVVVQERSIADKIDRQLTHRGAARSVSGLAAMLAHEIKNPLSGIRGAAQLLEKDADAEGRELTSLIRDEADRIVKLVNSMEVFTDERPVERGAVNVHSVLDRVVRLARAGFAADVRLVEEYDPSLPPVFGSHDQLVQVFLNLVKNAVEATEGRQTRTVHLRTAFRAGIRMALPGQGGRTALPLEFTVADDGPGVPVELREHLFDPFVTGKRNGSGLGLALVAKVIRDHGGVIDFDTGDVGTTFRVLLPMWSKT